MILPVELSDALSKAEVAGKLNQMQKAHSEMEQRQFAAALKEKINVDAERTHETEKSDSVIISKDKQHQEQEQEEKKDEEESGQDDDKEKEAPPPPEHLDLTA